TSTPPSCQSAPRRPGVYLDDCPGFGRGIHQRRLASPLSIINGDQPLCGLEIVSFETLGEPIVDRDEKRNRLCGPILVAQQPGEACGGAQFPRQGSLPARPTERLLVMIFGRCRGSGSGSSLQQKKLTLDAQQLGN